MRINQSVAIIARRFSTFAVAFVPTNFGTNGFSNRSRSASVGNESFQLRRKAEITGHAQSGWSLHGSPATKATASITQKVELGSCDPDFRLSRLIFSRRSAIIMGYLSVGHLGARQFCL